MLHDRKHRFPVLPLIHFDLPDRCFLIRVLHRTGVSNVREGRSLLSGVGKLKQLDEFWMTQIQHSASIIFQSQVTRRIHLICPIEHIHCNESSAAVDISGCCDGWSTIRKAGSASVPFESLGHTDTFHTTTFQANALIWSIYYSRHTGPNLTVQYDQRFVRFRQASFSNLIKQAELVMKYGFDPIVEPI